MATGGPRLHPGITILAIGACLMSLCPPCPAGQQVLTDRADARPLQVPPAGQAFSFAILADVTDAGPNNLQVLARAVDDLNALSPDLVLTVGDMVQGYCDRPTWLRQWAAFKAIMDRLERPWFPVAGNHDVYWASGQTKPKGEHEPDYEQHIGPLWYAFRYKSAWFIVLYTDEGDPNTGRKSFSDPNCQRFSDRQLQWLRSILAKTKGSRQVFVFMHHPRWVTEEYGQQWHQVHQILAGAGVLAVFAGHHHILQFDGVKDGISYYRLGTAGGSINRDLEPDAFHHFFLVTVRDEQFTVAAVRIGSVYDPGDALFRRYILLPRTRWSLERAQAVEYQVQIPAIEPQLQPILQISIGRSAYRRQDDELVLEVLDRAQSVVYRQVLEDTGTQWSHCPVRPEAPYTIRLSRQKASSGPNSPAMAGQIGARLRLTAASPQD